jgi:hypothetical protein
MRHQDFSGVAVFSALLCLAAESQAQDASHSQALPRLHGWSAAALLGTQVRSADGDEVGEIEDLVFSSDDRVVTAVVSVGGVLGVAEKQVAVPYADLRLSADGKSAALPLTKAEIEAAPAYKAVPPAVGDARPLIDPQRAAPPDAEVRREANDEAQRAFAGDDPRVAEGIAENKKAYEDEEDEEARSEQ